MKYKICIILCKTAIPPQTIFQLRIEIIHFWHSIRWHTFWGWSIPIIRLLIHCYTVHTLELLHIMKNICLIFLYNNFKCALNPLENLMEITFHHLCHNRQTSSPFDNYTGFLLFHLFYEWTFIFKIPDQDFAKLFKRKAAVTRL